MAASITPRSGLPGTARLFRSRLLLLCLAIAGASASVAALPESDWAAGPRAAARLPAGATPREEVNGEILLQDLYYEQGYTILHVWGSHYEMGYAHGYLMAEWIQLAHEQFSGVFGYYWEQVRARVAGWTFLPAACEEEWAGMLAGVRARLPETTIDIIDLKAASTIGDWLYAIACRSTCCWDELVAEPYTTLAMRKLQFVEFPPQITQQWHHLICAWQPDDGSPAWVNFGFPSYVGAVTAVNEYGTLASLHDWNSTVGPDYPDALPRTMACRYALTTDLGPNPETHLQTAFAALHPHHAATGGFLNYYVANGGAGVIKHSRALGFYEIRLPRPEWMDGHVLSTNNSDIDGTSGILPWAPYYESLDPAHGIRATLEGLWATGYQASDMHMVATGVRQASEITCWFEGRLQYGTTGRVELEWHELFHDPSSVADELVITDPVSADRAYRYQARPCPAHAGGLGIWFTVTAASGNDEWIGEQHLEIFDALGRRVARLRATTASAIGSLDSRPALRFHWDGGRGDGHPVRTGIYLYRLCGAPLSGQIVWLGR